MKINETIHGFLLERQAELPELNAVLYEMIHEKTGLKLVWLKRAEENKTFGIAFTTLPWNDTGVFHILEHSVLCGSDRYPVREPFVELLKNSMNTFLNALTFPDKTVYPVSSRNSKDFLNLVHVYLDAVFCPAIYHKPEIFRQEGWHYELDENGQATYKGVVFNEMKGAFADADELLDNAVNRTLFPDTPYAYVSGGDPARIPDLTYEAFLDGHRKYYSPSNAYVFLDGDLDLDAVLALMNDDYLCSFEKTERIAPPAMQQPVSGGVQTVEYELSPEEALEGHTRLAWGSVIGSFREHEKLIAMQILAEMLCGSNQSPLTRAVLSRNLAENVTLSIRDGMSQNWACLEVQNLKEENLEQVRTVVTETLKTLAEQGLDHSQLEAIMSNLEFRMRERDYGSYPQGLIYGFTILESWLYGGRPEAMLEVGSLFTDLRAKLEQGYFEQLLREMLLENTHSCQVIMKPSHTAGEERRQLEADRIAEEQANWTEEQRAEIQAAQESLQQWQSTEDTPEQLATLPHLQLEDIEDTPERLPMEQTELCGIPMLLHQVDSSGIVYLTMYFDADFCSGEELSAIAYLCTLLGDTRTSAHSSEELIRLDRLLCGSSRYHLVCYAHGGESTRKFCVTLSVLEDKLEPALELLAEILTDSQLDEEDAALEILRQNRQQLMEQIIMSGASVALGRVTAQYYPAGAAGEYMGGFAFYQWMKQQENAWNWAELSRKLRDLLKRLVNRSSMTLSVTGNTEVMKQRAAEKLAALLPASDDRPEPCTLELFGRRKEGILIPADIAFAVRGGDFRAFGGKYSGIMPLAGRIISLSYLWNMIRVQGGAYGCGFVTRNNGLTACYSYRDPGAAGSLKTYPECGAFLKQFCEGSPDLTGFIIGAVSDGCPLMTPRMKGQTADGLYWQGTTWEKRCQRRKELLSATPEQLAELADVFAQTLEDGGICVIGGQQQLDACGLDEILSV